jgi:hypothetical protein
VLRQIAKVVLDSLSCFAATHHGKLRPERIANQLWDLAAAVKHIAEQYAVDHLPHSPSAAGHFGPSQIFPIPMVQPLHRASL